jgi:hypothetical protein
MKIEIEHLAWLNNKPTIKTFEGTTEEFKELLKLNCYRDLELGMMI